MSNETCGAWGGCDLPKGHNVGNVDIPENHHVPIHHNIEEESGIVNTLLLYRIYDVLSLLLANIDPVAYEKVMQAHEAGVFIGPAPAMIIGSQEG